MARQAPSANHLRPRVIKHMQRDFRHGPVEPSRLHLRYLLDSNVLIDADRDYYPIDRVPEFWEWLLHLAEHDLLKVPIEVFEEIKEGKDQLSTWIKEHKAVLLEETELGTDPVRRVVERGYAPDLTEDELEKLGADPFIVGYGVALPEQVTVVTMERSKPNRQRANRHIPDVCAQLGVPCIDTYELLRRLDFRTDWRRP